MPDGGEGRAAERLVLKANRAESPNWLNRAHGRGGGGKDRQVPCSPPGKRGEKMTRGRGKSVRPPSRQSGKTGETKESTYSFGEGANERIEGNQYIRQSPALSGGKKYILTLNSLVKMRFKAVEDRGQQKEIKDRRPRSILDVLSLVPNLKRGIRVGT